jgi:hypothetical protein
VDDGGSVTIYPGVDDALTATAAAACAALPAKPSRAQLRRATAALTDAAATGQATVAAMRAAYAQLEVVCVAICSLDAGDVEDTQCMRHLGGRGNPYGRYAAD